MTEQDKERVTNLLKIDKNNDEEPKYQLKKEIPKPVDKTSTVVKYDVAKAEMPTRFNPKRDLASVASNASESYLPPNINVFESYTMNDDKNNFKKQKAILSEEQSKHELSSAAKGVNKKKYSNNEINI